MAFVPEILEEGDRITHQGLLDLFQFIDRIGAFDHGKQGSRGKAVSDGEHILFRALYAFVADEDCDAEALLQLVRIGAGGIGLRGRGFRKGKSGEQKQKDDKAEEQAKMRERESRLSMKMIDATLQLSIVEANALTGGHNNGNVERARAAAEAAQIEYHAFLQDIAAHEVSK